MRIENDVKLDFKDVLIRPKRRRSIRATRSTSRTFRFLHTGLEWKGIPLIAANMDVTGTMAMAGRSAGRDDRAAQALSREASSSNSSPAEDGAHAFYSFGITEAISKSSPTSTSGRRCAHMPRRRQRLFRAVPRHRQTGARRESQVDHHGRQCRHRRHDGSGHPRRTNRQDRHRAGLGLHDAQGDWRRLSPASAIIECADAAHRLKGQVCADGGCTVPGDVAKSLRGGRGFRHARRDARWPRRVRGQRSVTRSATASACRWRWRIYGMSSETAMKKYAGGVAKYRAAEGKTVETPYRGPVDNTMGEIMGGVRSMMTYIGANAAQGGGETHHLRARHGANERHFRRVLHLAQSGQNHRGRQAW